MADHIFICYARNDEDFVLKLASNLKEKGVPIWLDQWDIPPGANWNKTIDEALYECAKFLIVLSPEAVDSEEVEGEWITAKGEKKPIIPILFRQCRTPRQLQLFQHIDFTASEPDDSAALEQILSALSMEVLVSAKPGGEGPEVLEGKKEVAPDVIKAKRGGYELVRIPDGYFVMGETASNMDPVDLLLRFHRPQHEVHVPGFYIGRYPVTNAEYGRFLKENPKLPEPKYWAKSRYNKPRQPVVGVNWLDAKRYAEWAGLRLPSEAEWEYACRAGSHTKFYTGNKDEDLDRAGWFGPTYSFGLLGGTYPVGEKEPNDFGLYDMHGNVFEWVEDDWHKNYKNAPEDGGPWVDKPRGAKRVARGGSWTVYADNCCSQSRYRRLLDQREIDLGFRLARCITLGPD